MIPKRLNNFAGHVFLLLLMGLAIGQVFMLALYLLVSFVFWDWATWSWMPFRIAAALSLVLSVAVSFDPDFRYMSWEATKRGPR